MWGRAAHSGQAISLQLKEASPQCGSNRGTGVVAASWLVGEDMRVGGPGPAHDVRPDGSALQVPVDQVPGLQLPTLLPSWP